MRDVDWQRWHAPYDEPGSPLARRLHVVQRRIGEWLDEHPQRPVRIVSACAGEARDLLGVLAGRSDAGRVSAVLLEADERNVARAREAAAAAGLDGVEVRHTDAG